MLFEEEPDLTGFRPVKLEENDRIAAAASRAGYSVAGNSLPAPDGADLDDMFDSLDFLDRKRGKQLEELKRGSTMPASKRIKRSDIKAFTALLELDPSADENDDYFEEEGVDFLSALLGDVEPGVGDLSDGDDNRTGNRIMKKTSFLGVGSGPLQIGHFIGAVVALLMAFVEYPGFPLTNLPDPLRGALQGGLATIYLVNAVLAVLAAVSAPERNQPALLWAAKAFAVGGIAYDQLMQIPTPEETAARIRKEEEATRMIVRRGRKSRG